MYSVIEVEADLPLSIEEVRAALRVTNTLENAVLARKFKAAVLYIEGRTNRLLRRHTLDLTLDGWPCYPGGAEYFDGAIRLQRAPVRAVETVEYRDAGGAWVEIAADQWEWSRRDFGAIVEFARAYEAPALSSDWRDRVRIRFDAGYETGAETGTGVDPELEPPEDLIEAALMLAGHWFENREAVTEGDRAEVPLALRMIIDSRRIFA